MVKTPIASVTYDERISIKNSLLYIKCVLRLSCVVCVVHGLIHGRFMKSTVNDFLSIERFHSRGQPLRKFMGTKKVLHEKRVQLPQDWFERLAWPMVHCFGTPK